MPATPVAVSSAIGARVIAAAGMLALATGLTTAMFAIVDALIPGPAPGATTLQK